MTEKPNYWAVMPAAVRYDTTLPPNAKLLYAEISSLTDQRGYCYASNSYFEQLYELSRRTIQNLLLALQRGGYIRIEDGSGGSQQRKIYAGINPLGSSDPVGGEKNCTGAAQKTSRGGAENFTRTSKENKKENSSPHKPPRGRRAKSSCDYEPELFERFWECYPRHDGKAEARYEWDDLKPDRELMWEMSAALRMQKASDEWLRGIGIPWACRWIRNRRWENEGIVKTEPTVKREEVPPWVWELD